MKRNLRALAWIAMTSGLLSAAMLTACNPDSRKHPDDQAQLADDGIADKALQASLEGVWASTENAGTDDAETVYLLEWDGQASQLRIVRDDQWLAGKVEDVDQANRTVAFNHAIDTSMHEMLTLQKIPDDKQADAFHLRIVYGNGQVQQLGFVRRLTTSDRALIADARTRHQQQEALGDGPMKPGFCDHGEPANLRQRLVCNDQAHAVLDAGLRVRFEQLTACYPDGEKTVAAAEKQLDACANSQCLKDAYAHWQAYLDETYGKDDVCDYR